LCGFKRCARFLIGHRERAFERGQHGGMAVGGKIVHMDAADIVRRVFGQMESAGTERGVNAAIRAIDSGWAQDHAGPGTAQNGSFGDGA